MFKKKICCVASVNLTNYSPAALRRISKIANCALVFLPENPSVEYMEAFNEISLINVANVIHAPSDKTICSVNGSAILKDVSSKNFYIVNGEAVVLSTVSDEPVPFIVNGQIFYKDDINIECISANGEATPVNFDYEKVKIYQERIEINADFIKHSEQGTYIICMSKIKLSEDVTDEILSEKGIHFICSSKIYCKQNVYGYVAANSQGMDKIITDAEEYKKFIIK